MASKLVTFIALVCVFGAALLSWKPFLASSPTLQTGTSTTAPTPTVSGFKEAMTTYFFVGEPSDASNDFIPNNVSYWDEAWQEHYGGVDSPDCRSGYFPCGFTPKENPFYVALAYAEFNEQGNLKASAKMVPWYKPGVTSLLKNHWVEVRHKGKSCFGQWEDVGPNGEDDFAYVFGKASTPVNTFGERAGLDVSPAMWKCLGMDDNATTSWRFVDDTAVPSGPWKEVVTSSESTW